METKYQDLLKLNYEDCVNYLKKKYGNVTKNYFSNPQCKSKSQGISRTKEGLYIHHVDEDKAILLADKEQALQNPWAYQLADRLVYCNLLEHLILHIKITEKTKGEFGWRGIHAFMIPQFNDIFTGVIYKNWMENCRLAVKDLKNEYLSVINYYYKWLLKSNTGLLTSFYQALPISQDYWNVRDRVTFFKETLKSLDIKKDTIEFLKSLIN